VRAGGKGRSGGLLRRILGGAALALALSACTSSGDLSDFSPSSNGSTTSTFASVTVVKPRFYDRDPHDWTGRTPFAYDVHGIDISKYQPSVDWQQARAGGVSFAFVKATEGGDRVDDAFASHWSGTNAAGIPRAAYHFFYFCRPASEQAAWYIANVPREKHALPPVLDMEWNPQSPTCKLRPNKETVRSEMRTFLSMVEKHYGKKPIIYTSIDFFDDNELASFTGYPYWLRSVADHPSDRYGAHPFTFWQYTGTGKVPGIKGDTDINVFNGSVSAWKKWVRANTH
jgi:lysozyme